MKNNVITQESGKPADVFFEEFADAKAPMGVKKEQLDEEKVSNALDMPCDVRQADDACQNEDTVAEGKVQGNETSENNSNIEQTENQIKPKDGEFGRFSDSKQLLSAYNALQSEFTKRCQKLKEIEARVKDFEGRAADTVDEVQIIERALNDDEFVDKIVLGDVRIYKRAIEKYLLQMSNDFVPPYLQRGGFSALTPVKKPKTLEDAKRLADLMMGK